MPNARIEVSRDGALYRVSVTPADALPPSWTRPMNFASHGIAVIEAGFLARAIGLPVIDTLEGGR